MKGSQNVGGIVALEPDQRYANHCTEERLVHVGLRICVSCHAVYLGCWGLLPTPLSQMLITIQAVKVFEIDEELDIAVPCMAVRDRLNYDLIYPDGGRFKDVELTNQRLQG